MFVMVVDDDVLIRRGLSSALTKAGYHVLEAGTATEALHIIKSQSVDLALIDLMLPDRQGWDLVKSLRKCSSLPIIIISAITDLARRVQLLQSGADDYLVKPFEPSELIARMEAIQRRLIPLPADRQPEVTFGPYRVNLRDQVCLRGKTHVALTQSEFAILEMLITAPGRVYSRDQLLERLHEWGSESFSIPRSIDVHISTLRAKIEPNPKRPRWIETVWGMGYRFRGDDR